MADETVSVAFDAEPADAHASTLVAAADRADDFAESVDGAKESLSRLGKSKDANKLVSSLKKTDRAADNAESALEKVADASEEVDDGFSVASGSVGTFITALLASEAVTAITDKIKELAVEVAAFAIESTRARRGAKGLLAQFAKDEGAAKTLFAAMAKQAETLGVSVKDVTEQWVDFRKKGASATEAIKLTALRADVLKVTESTEEADRATEEYFEAIEKGATHSEALKKVAKDFRVSGDGANAAAAKVHTFEGQMQAMKNTFAKAFGKAIEKAGPQLIRVAEGLAKITEKAIESGAIEDTVMAVVKALDFLVENWKEISAVVSAAWEIMVTDPLVRLVIAINNVAEAWGLFKEGVKSAVKAVGEAIDSVKETVSDWISAGGDLVDGFVKGVKDGIKDAIAAVSELGDQAMSALKSKLKIGSPSRVFAEMGVSVSEGFASGIEPVDVAEKLIATDAAAPPIAPAKDGGPATAPSVDVVVNFGATTADAADIELAVRRAVNDALIGYRQSVGAA